MSVSDLGEDTRRLASAIRRTARSEASPEAIQHLSAPAFRAIVAERLRALEHELGEVRVRVNGLLFVVAGAVITQLLLRLAG